MYIEWHRLAEVQMVIGRVAHVLIFGHGGVDDIRLAVCPRTCVDMTNQEIRTFERFPVDDV